MEKEMTILYQIHNNLYVNITNKCSSACVFCLRQTRDKMGDSGSLWLTHEPGLEEIKNAFRQMDMNQFNEIVFCGFGEPTERLDVLLESAKFVKKEYHKKIRINTNGQGDLINEKSIAPLFEGVFDTVSISLNTPDENKYNELVRSRYGDQAYSAMISFVKQVRNYVPNVILSTVETTITKEEEVLCEEICKTLNVTYKIRPFEA